MQYAKLVLTGKYLNGPKVGQHIEMNLAVFDGNKPINRDELHWLQTHGATVKYMPTQPNAQ